MKELHLKESLKLLVKILKHLEDINLIITPAEIQLLSEMRNKAKLIKPSYNKTGNSAKPISVRVRKILNAMLKLEPNYAQHINDRDIKTQNKLFSFFQRSKLHTM